MQGQDSQAKALSSFAMVKNGIGAGLPVDKLIELVSPVLSDTIAKELFDSYMREDILTYRAIAEIDLAACQDRRLDFVAAQTKVDLAAQALTAARGELDTLIATIPPTVQWTANGFISREYRRQETQYKAGKKTKARDENGDYHGKEKGHIYVPCSFKIVASAPLKDHNARGTMRKLGNENGRWITTASINLYNGETLKVEAIDADPRKSLDVAYTELAQRLIELDVMTTEELGFIVNPRSTDKDKRHETTLTNRPRDVLGATGERRGSDYVALVGDDRYV